MRWGPNKTLTEDERRQIVATYEANYRSWLDFLPGYDNFPYAQIKFNVTGWAVSDESLLQGSSDGFEVYTNFIDEDGLPTCNPGCSRHEHPDGDYSQCHGGAENRFHQFFLLDPIGFGNMTMAAATGFGFYVGYTGWETVGSKVSDWPLLLPETVSGNHITRVSSEYAAELFYRDTLSGFPTTLTTVSGTTPFALTCGFHRAPRPSS